MENRGNREIFNHREQRSQSIDGSGKMESTVNHETTRKIQMAEKCLAEATQPGFSLATFDQPLAKGFADEMGLVELLH